MSRSGVNVTLMVAGTAYVEAQELQATSKSEFLNWFEYDDGTQQHNWNLKVHEDVPVNS